MQTDQQQNPNHQARNFTRAQEVLERMSQPPTFKQVAVQELRRAAVVVPMLLTTGVSLLWINRKFFRPLP